MRMGSEPGDGVNESEIDGPRHSSLGVGIALGAAIGAALSAATQQYAYLGAGIALGVALGAAFDQRKRPGTGESSPPGTAQP